MAVINAKNVYTTRSIHYCGLLFQKCMMATMNATKTHKEKYTCKQFLPRQKHVQITVKCAVSPCTVLYSTKN